MDEPQTIELDCPPGSPRPGDLIKSVIAGTGLKAKEPESKLFGNWTWDYSEVPATEWQKVKAITRPRIEALYRSGAIRYGSW